MNIAFFSIFLYNLNGGDSKMDIISVKEPNIAVRVSQYPNDNKKEFLLVGRSNVGKSSFINTLVERKNFEHTSSKPGKTQTLIFYLELIFKINLSKYGNTSDNIKLTK